MSRRLRRRVVVYDTTLRDGAQGPGVSFTASDKLKIARRLDALQVEYVEAGWPGSNPKDTEVFEALDQDPLSSSRLAAFGATRRAHIAAAEDENLAALLASGARVCTLVGKASAWQVKEVLRVSRDENLAMITDSVTHLREQGREVIFDAEHYFDGFAADEGYTLATCLAAARAGASWIVCCDTNGGRMPHEVARGVEALREALSTIDDSPAGRRPRIGIHCHNDCDLAVANSLAAVEAGADMVQGTINGLGERCGNANLCSVVPNLRIKLGIEALSEAGLRHLTEASQFVSEIANMTPSPQQPFVGEGAFAHKGGQHVAAVMRHQDAYQHIDPALVGNHSRVLVSELGGRGNVLYKAREFGIDVDRDDPVTRRLVRHLKDLEHRGYSFEGADASFEMVIRRMRDNYEAPFVLLDFIALVERRHGNGGVISEATIKVRTGEEVLHTAAEGNGPVNALDLALRKALVPRFPQLANVRLHDYKVRILDEAAGTFAVTRVLIESGDVRDGRRWSTVGCSANIIEASWAALADSMEYALLKLPAAK
ncbi:MAG TPA: citramalate synthase [Candidatus Dormibacteraeota bacterium]|jgi:2-isopropylmalate synthase|nr:citramalate synthase [Candidatus Dormibacteraeota bacterium]